MVYWDRMV